MNHHVETCPFGIGSLGETPAKPCPLVGLGRSQHLCVDGSQCRGLSVLVRCPRHTQSPRSPPLIGVTSDRGCPCQSGLGDAPLHHPHSRRCRYFERDLHQCAVDGTGRDRRSPNAGSAGLLGTLQRGLTPLKPTSAQGRSPLRTPPIASRPPS